MIVQGIFKLIHFKNMKKTNMKLVWREISPKTLKILIIMKLTFFIFIISALSVWANDTYSQSKKLTFGFKESTVEDVLSKIESQSEFYFLYSEKVIDVKRKVSFDVKDENIETVLNSLFAGTDVAYLIKDRIIVLSTPEIIENTSRAVWQQATVTGKVTNTNNEPIIGVTVVVQGTTKGAVTDINGDYSLSGIPPDATLVFSFIGMKKQEIIVGRQIIINVVMTEETFGIDEVVAIGYGTVKKSDLTGSVSSISHKDLGDRQTTSIASLIQGKASGVDVTGNKIRIRGVTTFNNTDPLVVIDGFIGANIETINPNDIQSIEILKDASATAIYGSRGANGVILVTTKGGKVGPLKINVNTFMGMATTPKKLDVLNASQYIDYMEDLLVNGSQQLPDALKTDEVRQDLTVWQDEVFRTAHSSEFSVDFSGGSDKATYFMSIGQKYNEFITIGPSSSVTSIRNKNEFNLNKWFRIGNNFAFTYNINKGQSPNIQWSIQMPQYFPIYDPTNLGGYSVVDRKTGADGANPLLSNLSHPENYKLGYQTNLWAEINPVKGLVYRIQAGITGHYGHDKFWQDAYRVQIGAADVKNYLTEGSNYSLYPLIENTLTYTNIFGKHDFTVMAGNTWQNYAVSGGIGIAGEEFLNTEVKNVFLATSKNIIRQESNFYAYLSYFGRFNYQFNNRYLLTINMRWDGSPRFAPQNRWATFPSVAVAWKMHEESFIKDLNVFDQLKLRASWGVSGNDAIGDFRYVSQVWTNGVYYPLGGVPLPGATVKDNSSPDIKWESTDSKTIGVDMAFLKNSLTISGEYFIKSTNDILFTVPRPASMGYGLRYGGDAIVNAASCENTGFEFVAGYRGNISEFHYSFNANYTHQTNEVTGLGLGQPYLAGVSRTDIGYPIGYFYGFVADGVFMNNSELDEVNELAVSKGFEYYQEAKTGVGDVRYKDLNGDGRITWDDDRQMIGNSIPKHLYGFNTTLEYKGFDFNAFFQGIAGSDLYFTNHQHLRGGTRNSNQLAYVLDRWRSEAEPGNGIVPRAVIGDPNINNRPSTNMVASGNYLKLRLLSVGYTLPEIATNKMKIDRMRIYLSASNLITFSNYHSYDPEVGGESNLGRGSDNFNYPIPRTVVLGVQIGF